MSLRRQLVTAILLASTSCLPAAAHWMQYDYAKWSFEARQFGLRAREALATDEGKRQAVFTEAMEHYCDIWDEVDTQDHHGRVFSDMREVNFLGGVICAEMEKGLLDIAMGALMDDGDLLARGDQTLERAYQLGVTWKAKMANAPEFGPTPWHSGNRFPETPHTMRSMSLTVETVKQALKLTLGSWQEGALTKEEAFGRIMTLRDFANVAPSGPRREIKITHTREAHLKARIALELHEAIVGALHHVFVGREIEERFVEKRIEAAEATVRLLEAEPATQG